MSYTLLNKILVPNRVLDIWQSEEKNKQIKMPIIKATQINDIIDAELAKPCYEKMQKSLPGYVHTAKINIDYALKKK